MLPLSTGLSLSSDMEFCHAAATSVVSVPCRDDNEQVEYYG